MEPASSYSRLISAVDLAQFTRFTLWAAKDHLLYVTNAACAEDYRRLFFRDIQAIVIHKTHRGKLINALFAFLAADALSLALAGLALDWSTAAVITHAVIAGLFALGLIVNLALGPTCLGRVRTAVQDEPLFCFSRLPSSLRAARWIREQVEAAQGPITPEEAARRADECRQHNAEVPVARLAAPPPPPPPSVVPLRHYAGRAHFVLLVFLLVDLWHSAASFLVDSKLIEMLATPIFGAILVTVIVAMVRQIGTDIPRGLRVVTWVTLAYLVFGFFAGIVYYIAYAATHPLVDGEPAIPPLSPRHSSVVAGLVMFSTVMAGSLSLSGLVLLNRFRRQSSQPPVLPISPPPPETVDAPPSP